MATRASAMLLLMLLLFLASCDSTGPRQVIPDPDAVVATALAGSITIYWRDVSEIETSYEVEYSTDAVNWKALKTLPANSTAAQHSGVEYQVTYFYRVRACRVTECSNWVQTSARWATGEAPNIATPVISGISTNFATVGVTVTHGGLRTKVFINLTIADKIVYQSPNFEIEASSPGTETGRLISLTIFGLNQGTDYTAVVIAQNAAGTKSSEEIKFRTSKLGPPVVRFFGFGYGGNFFAFNGTWSLIPQATVDPGGMRTEVYGEVVEAGKSFSLARRTPPTSLVIATNVITRYTTAIQPLQPATTYKWHLIATNPAGSAVSDSVIFTTPGG